MINWLFGQRDIVTQSEVSRFQQEQQKRAFRFRQAWQAYCGEMGKPLRTRVGEYDYNVMISLPRLTVDKGVAALFGEETCFELEDGVTSGGVDGEESRTPEQQFLDGFWQQNKKMSFLQSVGTNGGIFGQVFVKIAIQPELEYPRLINLCPEQMDIVWDPEDIEYITAFIQTWHGVDQVSGKAVAYRETTKQVGTRTEPRWLITSEISEDGKRWQEWKPPMRWQYSWCPIHTSQNLICPNEVWGHSDIEPDILSAANAVNFAFSNLNKILALHAHPKLWGKGFQASEVDFSVDGMTVLNAKDGEINKIEMMSSLESAMQFANNTWDAYDAITRIPAITRGKIENSGQVQSGTALRILYGPLVEKTATKRLLYGDMLEKLCLHALEAGGFATESDIEIKWGNAMPADELGEAQVAEIHERLGVSKYTILEKLGYDAEKEQEKKTEEADAAMQREQAAMQQAFDRGQV